ncbi:DNA mismatch repair endonuclease MutL [Aurantimonas litoralis]|nr:DNA mismatch repair endonuclease MutL [Aurantimonas litoralis]
MPIQQLSDALIDQIAAGEVVERPASVVKELVENALDAGARRIEIATAGGGKNLIRISDDGCGIPAAEMPLAVRRHCTSKLAGGLDAIGTLGFRGEALPSIGSVGRLSLKSRAAGSDEAYEICVEAGRPSELRPTALSRGTVIEVRDLFHAVPARLKFLKSDRAESGAITEIVRRIAIAFPGVRFELSGPDRTTTVFEAVPGDAPLPRIADVLTPDFADNAIPVDAMREDVRLRGFAGIPTYNRGNGQQQFFYVNGRPVRDKTLHSALRGAYADVLARDRHPVAVLFLDLDPALVDVNVHPAKADVRFRDPGLVRGLIVGSLRQAFNEAGLRSATTNASGLMARFRGAAPAEPAPVTPAPRRFDGFAPGGFAAPRQAAYAAEASPYRPLDMGADAATLDRGPDAGSVATTAPVASAAADTEPTEDGANGADHPLGAAKAQFHRNFIVSETEDGIVIVDQHAAHERLVYEALKTALHGRPLASQLLLIPEIVDLPEDDVDRLAEQAETFARLGLGIERFGPGAVAVRETPAILGSVDCQRLVRDLADELAEAGTADAVRGRIDHVAATIACHGSVRSGRLMKPEEMNALLRDMEATPGSGQCNHGRPTFIELKLADIEKMFGRR